MLGSHTNLKNGFAAPRQVQMIGLLNQAPHSDSSGFLIVTLKSNNLSLVKLETDMAGTSDELPRKIFFYRIADMTEVIPHLSGDVSRIANLPWTEEGRYLVDGDGNRLALWPETVEFPIRLRFGKTRMGNLPVKEQSGKLERLELAVDQGLVELCHVVIYEEGYVAAEYNHSGPRMGRLSDYLFAKKNGLQTRPQFNPLFQKNIIALVEKMAVIKFFELKGTPSASRLLEDADQGLGQALDTLGQVGAEKSIELVLSAEGGKRSRLHDLSIKVAKTVLAKPSDTKSVLTKLKVRGLNAEGGIDAVDILEQHMVSFKAFEKESPDSKAVSSDAAFAQIDKAYSERYDELQTATIGQEIFQ